MAIMVGTGRGARAGILIRNAEALEIFGKVDTLIIDKTGTLTEGQADAEFCHSPAGLRGIRPVATVASLERSSEHPLAAAIVKGAEAKKLSLADVVGFNSDYRQGREGNRLRQAGCSRECRAVPRSVRRSCPAARSGRSTLRKEGQTVMLVAVDGKAAGIVGVADPIKESTPDAIRELREAGLKIIMVTGDNATTAKAVADKLGIEFYADVLPQRKRRWSKSVRKGLCCCDGWGWSERRSRARPG
jgi:Cu+-exporting ATPase